MHMLSSRPASLYQPLIREQTRFWRDARFGGMKCMSATFITHRFSPHAHEHFGIGAMETGQKIATIRGCRQVCGPGDLYLINPEEIHDGSPAGGVYRYRMIYPSVAMVCDVLQETGKRPSWGTPSFRQQIVTDPALAQAFNRMHRQIEQADGMLGAEEGMLDILTALFTRHGAVAPASSAARPDTAMERVRDYLRANFAEDIGLDHLAGLVGFSRAHLIRSFRATFHITPHAYLTLRRIREAESMLAKDAAPADVAFACGFADQAHFTRNFKARMGMTPAQFRRG
ncbi:MULTISPECIES: AraC family transcriptional regulator [Rhizobium/Agrobacterium group]|uniref:AraC family transcriptional regulator n=1 Tax=Rhizobium/Agrobacterium group TaxID=227290 RepID=UPI000B4050FE|nr:MULTISPECIES: AraC family transcriptional regulator [Rhizobium/Agrobacterium group]NSZ42228.1 AraC family transcriptional regulator [Agrobacterium vitis]NTA25936.1 AraC family transcriptional regulator [Allorhizobium ampelinum]OVE96013.1 AraC family transcriptional regulator [Allorhizobium ampelinum]